MNAQTQPIIQTPQPNWTPILISNTFEPIPHSVPRIKKEKQPSKPKPSSPNNYDVQPLDDPDVKALKDYLYNKPERYKANKLRDYTIFVLGLNTGRRCGDLLQMKYKDVINLVVTPDGSSSIEYQPKDFWELYEQKTEKYAEVALNQSAKDVIMEYVNSKTQFSMDDYMFQSYRKKNTNPIATSEFWWILKTAAKEVGIMYNIGTHSQRKTFGANMIKNNPDNFCILEMLRDIFNHRDTRTTLRYTKQNKYMLQRLMESNQL